MKERIVDIIIHYFTDRFEPAVTEMLLPLTKLDPLFLYELIYICPKSDLFRLIPKVPPFLVIAFRATELERHRSLEKVEVSYEFPMFP